MVFTLAGLACRHHFLVVEGSSMVLLGNDFLHSRGTTINLSITGPCSMTLLTGEDDRKAHNVLVTTIPGHHHSPRGGAAYGTHTFRRAESASAYD